MTSSRRLPPLALALMFVLISPAVAQDGDGRPFMDRASQAASAGHYVDALAAYAEAIAAAPERPDARVSRAQMLSMLGHDDLATADYRAAARLSPNDAGLQSSLCFNLALTNHDLDGGLVACNAAISLEPTNPAILSTRGYLQLRRGAFAEAEKDYAAALALYPAAPNEMFGYGIAIIHLGRVTEGRGEIASATLDSSGLVSDWIPRGFNARGEVLPGKPVTTASQPVISVSDRKLLLNRDEEYVAIAHGCGRIVAAAPPAERARITQKNSLLTWIGDCRFGLIHGEGIFAGSGADTPVSRFAYGREVSRNDSALERKLNLAYQPAETALIP